MSFDRSACFLFVASLALGGCDEAPPSDGGPEAGLQLLDPSVTGPCEPREAPRQIQIARAGRTVFLTIHHPGEPSPSNAEDTGVGGFTRCPAGPHPLVLLAPEGQQDPAQYASYARHLASFGFVAALVDYVDHPLTADHREAAADLRAAIDWALGENLDRASFLFEKVDSALVGAIGHGSGATIALLAAIDDARIRAIAALDPVDGNPFDAQSDPRYPSVAPDRMARVPLPLLLLGELVNGSCPERSCRPCAPLAENYQQFYRAAVGRAYEITFIGADHNSWLDDPSCGFICDACSGGTAADDEVRRLSRSYVAAFLLAYLRGLPAYRGHICSSATELAEKARGAVSCQDKGDDPLDGDGGGDSDLGDGGDGLLGDGSVDVGALDTIVEDAAGDSAGDPAGG